ncbi:MAG: hypothetical protein GWP08_02995 [Nitrospiraceae bacterium]|nr:hypothetical protein [Nitrospiraceae bacterium]
MSLLGLDIGVTGAKAVAFDLDGRVVASAYREYPLLSPQPGWQESDPNHVWQCVKEILAETAAATSADPIQALAVSSQGEACHPVGHDGASLANTLSPFDARTAGYVDWWLERKTKFEITQITGMPLHGMYTINKILWFKEHRPDIYAKTWKFLCYEDFIHHKLGLDPVMSHPMAARTMAFDIRSGDWSDELLGLAGIDPALLPKNAPSGSVVGTISNAVADDLGLPHGVVVATGGHDQPAAALGAGVLESDEAIYSTGTTECICACFDTYSLTEEAVEGNVCCYPSCVPGLYVSLGFNFTGGALLKWYRDNFGGLEKLESERTGVDVYEIICRDIPEKPESLVLLPHFSMAGTPYFDNASRGAILGLTLNTPREALVSAILSGVTYEMKLNLALLQSVGVSIGRLRATGGGAKNAVWIQRKADIMGVPIAVLHTSEAASLGAAMLGGKASGVVDDLREMARRVVKIERVVEPDTVRSEAYNKRFAIYRDLYPTLKKLNHRLAELEGSGR